eukprot:scaffold515166_cov48-Prasinocladus_malaysianus.AAC.1
MGLRCAIIAADHLVEAIVGAGGQHVGGKVRDQNDLGWVWRPNDVRLVAERAWPEYIAKEEVSYGHMEVLDGI